jgi:hypothetical protein
VASGKRLVVEVFEGGSGELSVVVTRVWKMWTYPPRQAEFDVWHLAVESNCEMGTKAGEDLLMVQERNRRGLLPLAVALEPFRESVRYKLFARSRHALIGRRVTAL